MPEPTEADLEQIAARFRLAQMAGTDADDAGNGWTEAKRNAVVRSWQDVAPLLAEVRQLRHDRDEYESVRILRLQPGDVVVIRVGADITKFQAEGIRDELKPKFPGHDVLVLGPNADVEILRDGD